MGYEFTGVLFIFLRKFLRCQIYLFIFSVDYRFLLLTADIFFVYILFKKDTKIKKTMKYSKKMNSLKKGEGVPLLTLKGVLGSHF